VSGASGIVHMPTATASVIVRECVWLQEAGVEEPDPPQACVGQLGCLTAEFGVVSRAFSHCCTLLEFKSEPDPSCYFLGMATSVNWSLYIANHVERIAIHVFFNWIIRKKPYMESQFVLDGL
jgi:hypothetical protein